MHVEKALVALLEGHEPPPPFVKSTTTGSDAANAENDESKTKPIPKPQRKKGETRVLLPLSVLEEAVFGSRSDPERAFGRRKNRAFRGVREDGEWRSVDMEDDDSENGDGTTYTKRPEPISTWEGAEDFDGEDLEIDGGVRLQERGDWDDEEDGDWVAPTVPNPKCDDVSGCGKWEKPLIKNPAYKGKWTAPYIDNPAYKGVWAPRKIKNPDYYEDKTPSNLEPMGAVSNSSSF